jgi:hypothetical protein
MSSFTDDDLVWVQVMRAKPGEGLIDHNYTELLGVYTNSANDRKLLQTSLHRFCGDDETAKKSVNEHLSDPSQYATTDRTYPVKNSHAENTFWIDYTMETNPTVAQKLRNLDGTTSTNLYTVRLRLDGRIPGKDSDEDDEEDDQEDEEEARNAQDAYNFLDDSNFKDNVQSGGRIYYFGDEVQTFLKMDEAMKMVRKRTRPKPDSGDLQEVRSQNGVFIAVSMAGDSTFKEMYWVTKAFASGEERRDVYDLE